MLKLTAIFEIIGGLQDDFQMAFNYLSDHGNKTIQVEIKFDGQNYKDALNLFYLRVRNYQGLQFFNSVVLPFEI